MSSIYSILIDLGVLGFFGLLYYWWQKRRIIRASVYEVKESVQEFLYDLHSYLEKNKSAKEYSLLDDYARNLEAAANTDDLGQMKVAVMQRPIELPQHLYNSLEEIEKLF